MTRSEKNQIYSAALQGVLANSVNSGASTDYLIRRAIATADAYIAALEEKHQGQVNEVSGD
ncbi:MAG: hypothetical protein H6550_16180 [Chitinophagales bacterium]|nr:hypothetical protein [Chitinophagales bacterium]